jgi:hypothetical protein
LSCNFRSKNDLKHGDDLSPQEGPGKSGGTEIKWDTSAGGYLIDASKEVGPEINASSSECRAKT